LFFFVCSKFIFFLFNIHYNKIKFIFFIFLHQLLVWKKDFFIATANLAISCWIYFNFFFFFLIFFLYFFVCFFYLFFSHILFLTLVDNITFILILNYYLYWSNMISSCLSIFIHNQLFSFNRLKKWKKKTMKKKIINSSNENV